MAAIVFLVFFVSALQAMICRSMILGMLALVCLLSSILLQCVEERPRWVRLLAVTVPIILLSIIIQRAGWYDALYMGKIAQYRVAAINAALLIGGHILFLMPKSSKERGVKETQDISEVTP